MSPAPPPRLTGDLPSVCRQKQAHMAKVQKKLDGALKKHERPPLTTEATILKKLVRVAKKKMKMEL